MQRTDVPVVEILQDLEFIVDDVFLTFDALLEHNLGRNTQRFPFRCSVPYRRLDEPGTAYAKRLAKPIAGLLLVRFRLVRWYSQLRCASSMSRSRRYDLRVAE